MLTAISLIGLRKKCLPLHRISRWHLSEAFFKYDKAANFDKINVPVRFINSDKYPTNIKAAKRHKKDFNLKIIEGVGHFPMLEKPDEFNSVLNETIEELLNR